jgi:hypothetical protein
MSLHDWALVDAGIFHDFRTTWIGAIRTALNEGVLPKGYYALAEQHCGGPITDVLTLHVSPESTDVLPTLPPMSGGTAVAEAPPRVRRKLTVEPAALARRRSLAIRHVSGHRLIALLEIVSPANKDREVHVRAFVDKAESALLAGVHLLVIDLFRPGPHDPGGVHAAILRRLEDSDREYEPLPNEPFTLTSFAAGPRVDVYSEHLAIGAPLPEMPLFLRSDRYVKTPLETTYQATYRGVPEFYRDVLEGRG